MKFSSLLRILLLTFIVVLSCGHPLDYFYKEIANYGYHTYAHPMKVAGTGTLVGGSSSSISIISHPYTCFPKEISKLRCRDETTLPSRSMEFSIDVDLQAEFFNTLQTASPAIKANFKMKEVHKVDLKMKGIHIEYIDTMRLLEYHKNQMSPICRQSLQSGVSFITQVMKVDELEFSFYKKNNGRILIDAENIKEYLDLSVDIEWTIEENTRLIIKTPKYIGYQLGKLIKDKDGMLTVFRTKSTGKKSWKFYEVLSIDPNFLAYQSEEGCNTLL